MIRRTIDELVTNPAPTRAKFAAAIAYGAIIGTACAVLVLAIAVVALWPWIG